MYTGPKKFLFKYLATQQYPGAFQHTGGLHDGESRIKELAVYIVSVVPEETEALKTLFGMYGVEIVVYDNMSFFPRKLNGYETFGGETVIRRHRHFDYTTTSF